MWPLPAQLSTYWVIVAFSAFLAKQFAADFLLQTSWMAHGKERASGWAAPLFSHTAVHAVATGAIFAAFAPALAWLAGVDFVVHSLIDRGKGMVVRKFELTHAKTLYWWLLGADQTLHHATHLAFAIALAAFLTNHGVS